MPVWALCVNPSWLFPKRCPPASLCGHACGPGLLPVGRNQPPGVVSGDLSAFPWEAPPRAGAAGGSARRCRSEAGPRWACCGFPARGRLSLPPHSHRGTDSAGGRGLGASLHSKDGPQATGSLSQFSHRLALCPGQVPWVSAFPSAPRTTGLWPLWPSPALCDARTLKSKEGGVSGRERGSSPSRSCFCQE